MESYLSSLGFDVRDNLVSIYQGDVKIKVIDITASSSQRTSMK